MAFVCIVVQRTSSTAAIARKVAIVSNVLTTNVALHIGATTADHLVATVILDKGLFAFTILHLVMVINTERYNLLARPD